MRGILLLLQKSLYSQREDFELLSTSIDLSLYLWSITSKQRNVFRLYFASGNIIDAVQCKKKKKLKEDILRFEKIKSFFNQRNVPQHTMT